MKIFRRPLTRLRAHGRKPPPPKMILKKSEPENKPPVLNPDESPRGYKIRWHH